MRVRAEDGGRPAVEVDRHRDLLARRLTVEVEQEDRRLPQGLLHERVHHLERPHRRGHEQVAEQIEDRDPRPVAGPGHGPTASRRGGREVGGPNDAVRSGEIGRDLLPAPDVVAERDHVDARFEQPAGELRRDPDPVGRVLAVGDDEVEVELVAQPGQQLLDRAHARTAVHVSDEENSHL
jgi:hypothetical protein